MRPSVILQVFGKEITDISRDRRALVISVLIPLLLFPLSFFAMNINMKKTSGLLESGIPVFVNVVDGEVKNCLASSGRIIFTDSDAPLEDLSSGRLAALLDEESPGSGKVSISLTCDNTSQYSSAACDIIHGIITGCAAPQGENPQAVDVNRVLLVDEKAGAGMLLLQMLLPMLILVFSATAPMAVAADLFAGERERGTLEQLLSAPVTGAELLAGKYMAALCAGMTGVLSFMAGIALSFITSPDVFGASAISFNLSPVSVILALLVSIAVIMLITAMDFVISIFSGSVREAQILFIPVIIIAMACGHAVTMIDVKRIPLMLRHLPLVNCGLSLKELMAGITSWQFIIISAAWTIALVILLLLICRSMLSREKYIFRN